MGRMALQQDTDVLNMKKNMVRHYHREMEFGAVKVPATREALALSIIDAMDADIWKYEDALAAMPDTEGEIGTCGQRDRLLGCAVYKSPK